MGEVEFTFLEKLEARLQEICLDAGPHFQPFSVSGFPFLNRWKEIFFFVREGLVQHSPQGLVGGAVDHFAHPHFVFGILLPTTLVMS